MTAKNPYLLYHIYIFLLFIKLSTASKSHTYLVPRPRRRQKKYTVTQISRNKTRAARTMDSLRRPNDVVFP